MSKRPSGGQRTAAARQQARSARIKALGLKRVTVLVPAERQDEIKQLAARLCTEIEAAMAADAAVD